MRWCVYILESTTVNATYTGTTVDVDRRLRQHNGELRGGAKSTRRGRPWRIRQVFGPLESRSEALKLEAMLRRTRKAYKQSHDV